MDREHVMEGVVDLSFEAFNDLDNLPSAAGRGWLAADLSQDDWTVPLGPGARTSQELCDEAAVRVSVRPVALACARRARGRAAAFLHANSWAGPRSLSSAFRCKPARGAIDSPYECPPRVSVCRRNVPWLRNCPSPRLSSEAAVPKSSGSKASKDAPVPRKEASGDV